MNSIITNTAAMAALGTLRSIDQSLDRTQGRISSGLRVGSASDDAAYWSIGRTMKSDDRALSAVQDALGLGAATVDIAYTGLDAAVGVVDEIKAKLVAASEPGIDKDKVNKEITQLKDQLQAISKSSTFNNVNWLNVSDTTDPAVQVVGSFVRDVNNNVSMNTIDFQIYEPGPSEGKILALIDNRTSATGGSAGILTSTYFAEAADAASNWVLHVNQSNSATAVEIELTDATSADDLSDMVTVVDSMLMQLTDAGAEYGALKMRVDLQTEFVSALRDWTSKGVGKLVDADMDEEATRLKAFQAQKQLTTQALSIANSAPSALLQLFQ